MGADAIPRLEGAGGPFLRRAWYVAGWADELGAEPQARVFLGQPVALFRDAAGSAHAIGGRCPHRFAALGNGRVEGDLLLCPYHGLGFGADGRCAHNPHLGDPPPDAAVPVYPVAERHGLLWIWMGEAERADPAAIPDFSWLTDPRWEVVRGATVAEGHYELYSDNILDLAHVNFVHPALAADAFTVGERRFWQDGETVHALYTRENDRLSIGIAALLGTGERAQDFIGEVVWHAPATLYFAFLSGDPGTPRDDMTLLPSLHAFTPETADTTHYIWASARDFALGDADFSAAMHGALQHAFEHEDMPIIRDSHRLMAGQDFWTLRPLVLPGDGGGVRARRQLRRMIAAEQGQAEESDA